MTRAPRLRTDLVVVEQTYRGEQSYIVKDPETHKYFRFRPVEMVVMQQFDGVRAPAELAAALQEEGLPFTPAAVEGFARKLRHMGLLERSLAERSILQMERLRAERHRRVARSHYTGSLLRMRWSVGDPDALFTRWLPRLKFFFSPTFLAISVGLFAVYFGIAVAKWPELSRGIAALYTPSTYTLETVLLLYATALVVIGVHELGHGFTCKYFGGEVHEIGAMLIYFQPAFYCNVNDAWTFPDLRARLWVTAAGSWIQLALAGVAAVVWWAAEPGTVVSQVALFAVVIGGVTTVLANANPLIPLDGYYALSDYLEIPNLRQRAFGYLVWLLKRYVLRLEVPQPPADDREKRVFVVYSSLAFLYSATILTIIVGAIFGWVGRTLGVLGVLALALLIWSKVRSAVRGGARAVVTSVREHRAAWRSPRLWRRMGGAGLVLVVLGLIVPWPITVPGRFTAAAPFDVVVPAPEGSAVAQVYVVEGERVPPGIPLALLRNLELERRALILQREVDSLGALEGRARAEASAADVRRLEAERAEVQAELTGVRARLAALLLRAPVGGVVVTPRLEERVGRWLTAGEPLLRLVEPDSIELRIALAPAGATLVRPGQRAALIAHVGAGAAIEASVASVAAASSSGGARSLEARVRLPAGVDALRPGVTGEAKITVRRSTVFGALWWAVRKRVRSDLLL